MVVFIAIELEQTLKDYIYGYTQKHVKPFCKRGRWVRAENYHITLKYIGKIKEQELIPLCDVLKKVAGRSGDFFLNTGCLGVFGKGQNGKARVLWLGITGEINKLRQLKNNIDRETHVLGYPADNRFSPHITLARDVVLEEELSGIQKLGKKSIPVTAISLMESRLEKGRRVYLPLSVHRFR